MTCNETADFIYPLLADVFYPLVDQTPYGNLKKQWVYDRTIAISSNPSGRKNKLDVSTENAKIDVNNSFFVITRRDLTQSSKDDFYSLTNILVTNIRDKAGNIIYNESSGPRVGKATLYEISTSNPIIGFSGQIEYFKVILTRSENQAVDL